LTALPRHSIFVDTSAFFALADRSDRYHRTTVTFLQSNTRLLVTSNFIVCETLTLIRMRLGYAAAIQFGKRLRDESTTPVAFIEPTDEQEAWRIFQRYKDHRFSFVDCTSFAIMERMKLNTVLAFDEDFRKIGKWIVLPSLDQA
jgi:predicted nucleic acid-binding protein